MKGGMMRVAGVAVIATFVFLSARQMRGSSTPNTVSRTFAEAQQTLRNAGVSDDNVTVTGENGDPNELVVCDHDPDGVDPSQPVTLEVAQSCQQEENDDRKRKKKKRR